MFVIKIGLVVSARILFLIQKTDSEAAEIEPLHFWLLRGPCKISANGDDLRANSRDFICPGLCPRVSACWWRIRIHAIHAGDDGWFDNVVDGRSPLRAPITHPKDPFGADVTVTVKTGTLRYSGHRRQ